MKKIITLVAALFFILSSNAQTLPVTVDVPPLYNDPNIPFNVLNFDTPEKDKFTVFYYHIVNASVMRAGEFVSDTGYVVARDQKMREYIHGSNSLLFLKKQTFDAGGHLLNSEEWLLAQRQLDAQNEYKMYFSRSFKHPFLANRLPITMNIYNLDAVKGLSQPEMTALVELVKGMIPPPPGDVHVASTTGGVRENTIAEDIKSIKNQFKSLRSTGLAFKGDLPSGEKVLTRYPIVSDRVFVITKTKGDSYLLKVYITADYKTFDCLDSVRVNGGDVTLTSAATIYNTNAEAVGAFANLHYKTKDEKGEDMLRQISIAMDADYKVTSWTHSVGKNKMNSLSPEVCWYEGDKLWVMSDNCERVFKTYKQLHQFVKGADAKQIFPASDEDKGSEKSHYVKNFQPETPPQSTSIGPVPDKEVPMFLTTVGETRYLITQGTKYDDALKATLYLTVTIYRIDGKGKITNEDFLSDYKGTVPLPIKRIIKNSNAEHFLLQYPVRIQMNLYEDHNDLNPLTADNTQLIEKYNREFITDGPQGSVMLKRSAMGNKYTILYYPKK
ncbi:MAG: hypothetical protein IT236_06020 [Bacteroidia bacterium]|nr:hypothetical protein [Bacteroidia bacterium]